MKAVYLTPVQIRLLKKILATEHSHYEMLNNMCPTSEQDLDILNSIIMKLEEVKDD